MKFLNLLKFFIYFVFAFFVFFIAGIYVFYKYKKPKNINVNSRVYELYPEDIILKTGAQLSFPEERVQHFLNFPEKKEKGTIRIGTFGDSHTFGAEVEKTATYPYYLQKLFDRNYPDQSIEILNFGVEGVGFPHQFFLWEKYAESYQLDYILLGPVGFYSNRNTRFIPPFSFDWFSFPQNRFILTDQRGIKDIHIKGKTLQERYKNYYRFIPSGIALQYDKIAFKVFEILIPFLRDKTPNPFYYTKLSEDEETFQINNQLLKKIYSVYPKKILFFTSSDHISSLYSNILNIYQNQFYNFNKITVPTKRFYEVFFHESSLGNELTAQVYFNALLGKTQFSLNVIKCYFRDENNITNDILLEDSDLTLGSSIEFLGGKNLLFNLKENVSDHHFKEGFYQKISSVKGIKSFLALLNKNNFLTSVYIPLSFQLKEGMDLYIKLKGTSRIKIGEVKSLDVHNKFFAVYLKPIKLKDDNFKKFVYLSGRALNIPQKKEGKLFIENNKLGRLKKQTKGFLKFIPENSNFEPLLAMGPQHSVIESDFSDEFPVFIKYQTTNGKNIKSLIPDWTCRKEKQPVQLDLPHFEALKL